MLNGIVSYFLTLPSINAEGKNKQAMSQIRESPIYKTKLIYITYSRGPKGALPPVVLTSRLPPLRFSERHSRDGASPSLLTTGPASIHSRLTSVLSGTYVPELQRLSRRESHHICLRALTG